MLPKRAYVITSTTFLIIGIIILLNSFQSLTGFVIFENANTNQGYFAAIWFIAAAILILSLGRTGTRYRFRGHDSLRTHNREARSAAEWAYRREHHKNPTKTELRSYVRQHHDAGDLPDIVQEYHNKRRNYSR